MIEEEDVLLHTLHGGIPEHEFVVFELRVENFAALMMLSA